MMSTTGAMKSLHGSCHCGRLAVEFSTTLDPTTLQPRVCDCSFCRKHGAAYVSDPAGKLSVSEKYAGALREYRQGSNTARFLLCSNCGVLVAVTFEHDARLYGAVNAGCLDEETRFAAAVPASPQKLSPEERISRWLTVWIPDVRVSTLDP